MLKKGDPYRTANYNQTATPIMGQYWANRDGKWLALKANNRSYNALLESWLITKANTFASIKKL